MTALFILIGFMVAAGLVAAAVVASGAKGPYFAGADAVIEAGRSQVEVPGGDRS